MTEEATVEEIVEETPEEFAEQEEKDFLAAMDGEEPTEPEPKEVIEEEPVVPEEKSTEEVLEEKLFGKLQERYDKQMRDVNGRIGGINGKLSQLEAAKAAAKAEGAEAPTSTQIADAMKSGEKLEALKADFPEFADAILESTNEVLNRVGSTTAVDELTAKLEATTRELSEAKESIPLQMAAARKLARLDAAFPEWEETVNDRKYGTWLALQPAEVREKHFSEDIKDAIELLTAYNDSQQPASEHDDLPASSRQNTERLEAAVTPTDGRSTHRRSHKSEQDEFLEAFAS